MITSFERKHFERTARNRSPSLLVELPTLFFDPLALCQNRVTTRETKN
ncbi:hypothetical protein M5D96_006772, partial [Drosophila gunungcola]